MHNSAIENADREGGKDVAPLLNWIFPIPNTIFEMEQRTESGKKEKERQRDNTKSDD